MRLITTILASLLSIQMAFGQSIFAEDYLAQKTTYFKVEDGKITGQGKESLEEMARNTQFIAFGERHNSAQTGAFMQAFLPLLAKQGFDNFALEVGPHSVKRLKTASADPSSTVAKLKQFNHQYFDPQIQGFLIPFFAGVEDAEFLSVAAEHGMELWGLDQEFLYAVFFLTDDMLQAFEGKANYEDMKSQKQAADQKIKEWLIKEDKEEIEIEEVFTKIQAEPAVKSFFNEVRKGPKAAKAILDDLIISWDIYARWRKGSHQDRISYMRNNFIKNYQRKEQHKANPKVLVKVGQVHSSKEWSNGAYDLGHLLGELAQKNGTKAISINSWNRYYQNEDKIEDYSDYPYFKNLKPFFQLAKMEEWTIIDLQSIRKDYESGKVQLPNDGAFHEILQLINSYDYQLFLPLDEEVTYNIDLE